MRKIILLIPLFVLSISAIALPRSSSTRSSYAAPRSTYQAPQTRSSYSSPVHTSGYLRRNGTYVQPHFQTAPNAIKADNWSSKPNVNPITGKPGTKDPWAVGKP